MSDYLAFTFTAFILALTPGPDILLVITTALSRGFKDAFLLTLGLASGVIVHTALIALGVSALIIGSPIMIKVIGTFGACYLFYLSYSVFTDMRNTQKSEVVHTAPKKSFYWRGVIMNISNPKVLLFFLALFPRFAQLDEPGYTFRILVLGTIFLIMTVLVFGGMAWVVSSTSSRWMRSNSYRLIMDWLSLIVFLTIGFMLLLSTWYPTGLV